MTRQTTSSAKGGSCSDVPVDFFHNIKALAQLLFPI